MNIGIFTDCYYPQINGVVTSTLILKEELEKKGHVVTIVTVRIPHFTDTDPNVLRIPSIPFRKWNELRIGVTYPSIIHKVKKLKLDIIHTQTEFSIGLMAHLIARILKIPIIHTYHTMYEDYTHYVTKRRLNRKIVIELTKVGSKLYLNECRCVIAPSEKTKKALLRYGVHNTIYTIPTGIKLDNFRNDLFSEFDIQEKRSSLGIQPNDKVILSLGRISEEKSIDIIIESIKPLLHDNSLIKLLIVGDGPYKNTLEQLVKKLNLENHVIFTGMVPWNTVSLYYQLSDVFVSASKTETQGLTILEGMAAGLPVIAKNDDNIKDVIKDGLNGKIFDNASDLPQVILEVLENDILRKKNVNKRYSHCL